MGEVKCLNPWDVQSKRQYDIDGIYCTLNAGQSQGGQAHGICYAIDQQGGKSNCGYAEDVMMTLCSDSHGTPHALCYAIEGNIVDRESNKNGKGWCENVSPTLNTQDRHAVVVALEGNGARPSHMGKGFNSDGTMYTLNTIEQHSVCYESEDEKCFITKQLSTASDVVPCLEATDYKEPISICYNIGRKNSESEEDGQR